MGLNYYCPKCDGLLNPSRRVIFVVEGGAHRGLCLLSPEPGDYSIVHAEDFPLEVGAEYTYRCPICRANLEAPSDEDFVEIIGRKADGSPIQVNFSRIFGKRATFLRTQERVERFGDDAAAYDSLNFFGAGEGED